jgi:hypothetical protein
MGNNNETAPVSIFSVPVVLDPCTPGSGCQSRASPKLALADTARNTLGSRQEAQCGAVSVIGCRQEVRHGTSFGTAHALLYGRLRQTPLSQQSGVRHDFICTPRWGVQRHRLGHQPIQHADETRNTTHSCRWYHQHHASNVSAAGCHYNWTNTQRSGMFLVSNGPGVYLLHAACTSAGSLQPVCVRSGALTSWRPLLNFRKP